MKSWKLASTILCCLSVISDALATCTTCDIQTRSWDDVLQSIWDPSRVSLSTDAKTFLANFKQEYYRGYVRASIYVNHFIPYLDQEPDSCAIALYIDSRRGCQRKADYDRALTLIRDSYLYDIIPRLEWTIIRKAGCACGDLKVNKTVCNGNGHIYPYDWIILPLKTESTVQMIYRLYRSNQNYLDRVIAASSYFSMLFGTIDLLNENVFLEATDLTLSGTIPHGCCNQRIAKAEEIRKLYESYVTKHIAFLKEEQYSLCRWPRV